MAGDVDTRELLTLRFENQRLRAALERLVTAVDQGYLVSVNYAPPQRAYPGLEEAANEARAALGDSGTRPLIDYEAKYVQLAQRPGFEGLLCPVFDKIQGETFGRETFSKARTLECAVPLPAAERLTALVEASPYVLLYWVPGEAGDSWWVCEIDNEDCRAKGFPAPQPWQALTMALLAAQGRVAVRRTPIAMEGQQVVQRAHDAVRWAIRRGCLSKPTTLVCPCGQQAKQYHHHHGYENHDLDVRALCLSCHRKAHWNERQDEYQLE